MNISIEHLQHKIKELQLLELNKPDTIEKFICYTNETCVQFIITNYLELFSKILKINTQLHLKDYITLYIIQKFPNIFETTNELKTFKILYFLSFYAMNVGRRDTSKKMTTNHLQFPIDG